jgi:hypothetical protein
MARGIVAENNSVRRCAGSFATIFRETRDDDRRQRLLEVAGFYRSLAGIIPAMPTRCKINGAAFPVTRAERWKARAEECRTLADCFTDQALRGQLTQLARDYDQMAVAAE